MSNSYRWQRRDQKLNSKKNKIPKHGKELGQIYHDSVLKRIQIQEARIEKERSKDIMLQLDSDRRRSRD